MRSCAIQQSPCAPPHLIITTHLHKCGGNGLEDVHTTVVDVLLVRIEVLQGTCQA